MNDIEDFTTEQLKDEVRRRETAVLEGLCWYCNHNLAAHTCKHAKKDQILPGWNVQQPRLVRTENCMGEKIQYWQVDAVQDETGRYRIGIGQSWKEATDRCIEHCRSAS